jgi:hypothetical protein
MATTKGSPPEGLSPEQRTAFDRYIEELSELDTAPNPSGGDGGPNPVTDAEWDKMTDRQRESWVRELVDGRLDKLAADAEAAQLRADVEALRQKQESEGTPQGPMPSGFKKLQKWLWGEPKE